MRRTGEHEPWQVDTDSHEDRTWLYAQLARYTYRPGWTLTIEDGHTTYGWEGRLRVNYSAPDSRNPEHVTTIGGTFGVPPPIVDARDDLKFGLWLQRVLFDVERHESREWLRRDGNVFDDPHTGPPS
jgi:hypothetical protein